MTVVVVPRAEPRVVALLERHEAAMRATSPAESCHVMAPAALWDAGAWVCAVLDEDRALGVGALKPCGDGTGEIKSMHTAAEARGTGIARTILDALMKEARRRGFAALHLETGSAEAFAAARRLYETSGFAYCAPFGAYAEDPMSVFMTRALD